VSVLLGVNAFPGSGEAAARQGRALASWRELEGVRRVNLGWADEMLEVDGFESQPLLKLESSGVSGRAGRRKPIVSEAFDHLAALAAARGCRWFAYANSDIAWTQGAVDAIRRSGREAYAFSRGDLSGPGAPPAEVVTSGIDGFAVSVEWWGAHRHRFRAYIGGEPIWDNVYTALLLSHADALLLNREPLVLHERHPAGDWSGSPFRAYLGYLATLDSLYFSRWAHYHDALLRLREAGASEAEELALQPAIFRRPFPARARLVQAARALRARARRALAQGSAR
jgi:hypothetical protein